jgi:hypothetical protein
VTVPGKVRADLAHRRAAGDDFEAAWASAVAAAPSSWHEALEATRAAWAAAFAGAANTTRGEQGVRAIVILRELAESDGHELHGPRGRRWGMTRPTLLA